MNPRAARINVLDGKKILVTFINKEERIFDITPYLDYPVYTQLKEEHFFQKAQVVNGIVVWNENIDLDPDLLYLESKPLETV